MKMTKRRASAGSSERREDAEGDASEQRGRKSQKPGAATMKQRAPLLPTALLACRMRAERLTVGHGNHPMGRYKLSRRYQPQGRRDGNDVRNDMPAQRHTIRNEKILVRGLPMAGIVCYRIIDLGVWRSG